MDHLSDQALINTYHHARRLQLSEDFLRLLEEEIYVRALSSLHSEAG
ncbi:sporulation histidine kinase inhibitor Sda [Salimicrobium halophilum]|uniref:Sporulation inhibitor A n=1 Tax=Salimicrobium halophilum TaxID=86666 RepID=A0A1G8PNB0_9BACI|nr:sporulation histidine kinase inhibitor Sda [Salimicrobium halophilum]SDI93963.1 Sporulation inhibitor A [Salimicrobium halophilum]